MIVKTCTKPNCKKQHHAKGFCKFHYQQQYRQEHLINYVYNNLKSNSKRRNKEFDLSFEDFEDFAVLTNYIGKRGRQKDSFSIDRIHNERGYTKDNIRSITVSENSRKGIKMLDAYWDPHENKVIATVKKSWSDIEQSNEKTTFDNCPF